MLKAIETEYKGYRMRSRLEARYAVFFDSLGIKWEYEKEGYVLPDGTWYLPDFWLTKQKRWIEVKGQEPTKEELEKAKQLYLGTGYPVCVFHGSPGDNGGRFFYSVRTFDGGFGRTGEVDMDDMGWRACVYCGTVDAVLRIDDSEHIVNKVTGEVTGDRNINACSCNIIRVKPDPRCASRCLFNPPCAKRCGIADDGQNSTRLLAAYKAARQARFEHNEHAMLRQRIDNTLSRIRHLQQVPCDRCGDMMELVRDDSITICSSCWENMMPND